MRITFRYYLVIYYYYPFEGCSMLGHLGLIIMALWPCSSRNVVCIHGYPVWFLVCSLKEHEIDEKTCTDHHCLHSHIQIHGELDTKVVRVCECFPQKSCPLLTDFPDLTDFIHGQNLKVNIWKAAPPTEGPVDLQYRLIVLVRNDEFWGERVPLLRNVPHRVTGGRLHLQLL